LIDNITKYSQSTNLEKILEKLRQLDAEKALQMAKEGIVAENPVQFFKDQFS
jgi:hypothetical protein